MIFCNPRLSEKEKRRAKKLPRLPEHIWVMTSGSSGAQKWVALSHEALFASAKAVNYHLDASKSDLWLHPLPDFHVGGIGVRTRAELSGARVEKIAGRWDPEAFSEAGRALGATLTALVPTQLHDLAIRRIEAPSTLRASLIGGGALTPKLYFEARSLGWRPLPSYGLTEAASQVATAELSSLDEERLPQLKILPHLSVAASEEGLKISGSSLLTAYGWVGPFGTVLEDPKKEGFFQTADFGSLEEGMLRVEGRRDLAVKVGGELVDIARLDLLTADLLPPGGDAAFAALPDERMGRIVVVAVAGLDAEQEERLIAELRRRLLPFERPGRLYRLASIPRSVLGKVQITALHEAILASKKPVSVK